uniref:Uncharacterized protein n=1 Tax=Lotharella oceanica TaxID=641309 RepID=A0A7S2TM47_9EUKA|mmetsp:Transcript_20580/g.38695  ORF Transcript_20580/g.38695 Transcript_20580/m.38695 type:complete len:210 (+) Transcript_20580:276-905(+)
MGKARKESKKRSSDKSIETCVQEACYVASSFWCTDAKNFPANINKAKTSLLEINQRKYDQVAAGQVSLVMTGGSSPPTLTSFAYQGSKIDQANAAACTTFATWGMYRLLTECKDAMDGKRIEMIAHRGYRSAHVFLVIGRSKSSPGYKEACGSLNEDGVLIYDPWLASLGWPGYHEATTSSSPFPDESRGEWWNKDCEMMFSTDWSTDD